MNPLICNTREEIEALAKAILMESHDDLAKNDYKLFYLILNCQRVIRYYQALCIPDPQE